ncbi:Hsp20/alpha crystallin family protein [Candidatus Kaiserbacteria bacterium]|nr:Hsp20/alpha crystallin family protein [Candidatus Kaiserbacteria bacterium]
MAIKRSFFDRLSGHIGPDDFDSFDDELPHKGTHPAHHPPHPAPKAHHAPAPLEDDAAGEGQLPVDVHQTASDIVIRAFVAGVRPDELSISISRDMVEIEGSRMEREQASGPDYFTRELFWGNFSRAIVLPQEIDVEASSASAKDGLLTIILPKLDKAKQTKLRVKVG